MTVPGERAYLVQLQDAAGQPGGRSQLTLTRALADGPGQVGNAGKDVASQSYVLST